MISNHPEIERRRAGPAAWRPRWRKRIDHRPPAHDIIYNPARAALRAVLIGAAVLIALLLLCWNAGLLSGARSHEWRPALPALSPGHAPRFRAAPAG
jgi:hypothetical protein